MQAGGRQRRLPSDARNQRDGVCQADLRASEWGETQSKSSNWSPVYLLLNWLLNASFMRNCTHVCLLVKVQEGCERPSQLSVLSAAWDSADSVHEGDGRQAQPGDSFTAGLLFLPPPDDSINHFEWQNTKWIRILFKMQTDFFFHGLLFSKHLLIYFFVLLDQVQRGQQEGVGEISVFSAAGD